MSDRQFLERSRPGSVCQVDIHVRALSWRTRARLAWQLARICVPLLIAQNPEIVCQWRMERRKSADWRA